MSTFNNIILINRLGAMSRVRAQDIIDTAAAVNEQYSV